MPKSRIRLLLGFVAFAIAGPTAAAAQPATDADVQNATASAREILTAVQRNDSHALGSYTEGRNAAVLLRSMRSAGHGAHRALADWDGRIIGVSVDGNAASVWFCKPPTGMLVLEMNRRGGGWVAQRIAEYRRVR